jgi:ribose/xylose/arabinose/galactoside ABC-type transport system permease subunit
MTKPIDDAKVDDNASKPSRADALRRRLATPTREKVLLLVLLAELIIFGLMSPYFFTVSNLLDTSRYFSETGLIAIGMCLIIITGGIDLSVGSLLALVSVVVGFSMAAGAPLPVSIALGLATGYLGGLFNGILVTRLSLSPLTVTLGTLAFYRGIAYALSNSAAVSSFPDWFSYFGAFYVGGIIPAQLLVFLAVAIVVGMYVERGRFGRYIRGIGYNPRATRFSGIDIRRTWTNAYVITGVLVAVAAVIYTSRVSTSRANAAIDLELVVIAAVVLGGASIKGGRGTILGTVLGVLILAFLQQGLGLIGAPASMILVAQGAVLLVAVFVNEFFRKRKE